MSRQSNNSNLQEEMNRLSDFISSLSGGNGGTEEDAMPEAYGEFGLGVTNPIPTNTTLGSKIYLERLQTINGTKVTYNRIGSMRAPNIKSIY